MKGPFDRVGSVLEEEWHQSVNATHVPAAHENACAAGDFTEDQAREFVAHVRASVADIKEWIVRAVRGRAWLALGYESWDAMCEAEFDGAVIRLSRADRREFVGSLREAGLSTRAIGVALGVDHKTVVNDSRPGGEFSPPAAAPASSRGLDGKTYPSRPGAAEPELFPAGGSEMAKRRILNRSASR